MPKNVLLDATLRLDYRRAGPVGLEDTLLRLAGRRAPRAALASMVLLAGHPAHVAVIVRLVDIRPARQQQDLQQTTALLAALGGTAMLWGVTRLRTALFAALESMSVCPAAKTPQIVMTAQQANTTTALWCRQPASTALLAGTRKSLAATRRWTVSSVQLVSLLWSLAAHLRHTATTVQLVTIFT